MPQPGGISKARVNQFLVLVFAFCLPYSVSGLEKSVRIIQNCNYEDKGICFDCAVGYTISKDQKQCIKCSIKDCFECSNDGKSCLRCKEGLSFDSKTKTCSGCKVANCQTCEKNLSTCTKCLYDVRTDTSYGLVGNTCVSCAKFDKNAITCDNNKVTACKASFYVDKARNACSPCASSCLACEGSATYCTACGTGYANNPVNGQCIPNGNLESDAQAPATTKSAAAITTVVQHIVATLALIFMM